MSYRTSYRTELRSESSGGEILRFRRRMLADVGHEVLRPLQPANARVLCQGSSEVRAADPGRAPGPLARQQADPAVAANGLRPPGYEHTRTHPSSDNASYSSPCSSTSTSPTTRNDCTRLNGPAASRSEIWSETRPQQPSSSRPSSFVVTTHDGYPTRGPHPRGALDRTHSEGSDVILDGSQRPSVCRPSLWWDHACGERRHLTGSASSGRRRAVAAQAPARSPTD